MAGEALGWLGRVLRQIPKAEGRILTGQGQLLAVRGEAQRVNVTVVAFQRPAQRTAADVPQLDFPNEIVVGGVAFLRPRCHRLTVRRKRDGLDRQVVRPNEQDVAQGARVPDAHSAVPAAAGQLLAVGTEHQTTDRSPMPAAVAAQDGDQLLGLAVETLFKRDQAGVELIEGGRCLGLGRPGRGRETRHHHRRDARAHGATLAR